MKKGYKRLLIFIIFLLLILFLNTFVINFLSGYKMILFLILLLVFFKYYFIFEKNKNTYKNDILFETIIYIISFFILYYLLGLIVGLTKQNYYTFNGIKDYIIPISLYIILREVFRYNMLRKADGNKLCTVLVVVLFIVFDISNKIYFSPANTNFELLNLIALVIFPAISSNISYSYITKKVGYKPIILFDLVFVLFPYLIPIIPSPNEYLTSIIYILVPIIFTFRITRFTKLKRDEKIDRNYHKKKIKGSLLPLIIILILVYFYSGYFKYYAIAIASASMSPNIKVGDTVIIDQKYNNLKINDVIAYKKNGIIIVHRIVDKIKIKNNYYYYTKGDNNKNIDNIVIKEDMIIGKAKIKIPIIGYPTVWFNNLVKE